MQECPTKPADAHSALALGRQTYRDSVFRTNAAGNIAADPTNPSHLAVV
jgi:hypothetical protein